MPGITIAKIAKLNKLKNSILNLELNSTYRDSIIYKINSESDIEVKSGYLLLLSSFDYWNYEFVDENEDFDDDDVHAIIQIDAGGYIIGWIKAVWDDYNAGTLSPEGQHRRIREAAYTGLMASTGGFRGR